METQDSIEAKKIGLSSRSCVAGRCSICIAISLLATILLLCVLFTLLDVPHGFEGASLRVLIKAVLSSVVAPCVAFIGEIVKSLFPWPMLVILAVVLVIWGPDRAQGLLASLKFEILGVKFDGTTSAPEAFRREFGDAKRFAGRTNKEIEQAYTAAQQYLVQLREKLNIDARVRDLSLVISQAIGDGCPSDFRLTVYIPDLIFDDQLYQLVEYYDKDGQRVTDDRSGRAFSVRYGIIGRVWRSGVAEVEGELISAEDRALIKDLTDVREVERFIARRWGLTLYEAARIRRYQSYGAIRVDRGESPSGLVFFDSKVMNAFGKSDIQDRLNRLVQESELSVGLLELHREVGQFPRIQIFRSR